MGKEPNPIDQSSEDDKMKKKNCPVEECNSTDLQYAGSTVIDYYYCNTCGVNFEGELKHEKRNLEVHHDV